MAKEVYKESSIENGSIIIEDRGSKVYIQLGDGSESTSVLFSKEDYQELLQKMNGDK